MVANFFENWEILMVQHPVIWLIFWIWTGLCVGSFLNVCIWRVPNGMSIVKPGSHCPKCGHELPFYENIPVISWLCLRAKCSSCKEPISARYPIVELLTGVLFVLIWLFPTLHLRGCSPLPFLLLSFVTAAVLTASAFTDCDCRIIPDGFVLTLLASIILCGMLEILTGADWLFALVLPICSMSGAYLFFYGFAWLARKIFRREALGMGDVKLLAVLTGFLSITGIIWALLTACICAMIFAPVLRHFKPKMRHRGIPMAPFIAIGTGVWYFFWPQLMRLMQIVQ